MKTRKCYCCGKSEFEEDMVNYAGDPYCVDCFDIEHDRPRNCHTAEERATRIKKEAE